MTIFSAKRGVPFLAFLFLIGLSVFLYRLWDGSPQRRVHHFTKAFVEMDTETLLSLCGEEERKRLPISAENLRAAILEATKPPRRLTLMNPVLVPHTAEAGRFMYPMDYGLADQSGNTTLDRRRQPVVLRIVSYRDKNSWHIGLSQFLVLLFAKTYPSGHPAFCRKYGLPNEMFDPVDQYWVPF